MADHDVLRGDARLVLRSLPTGTADCCVTSPPYFGLRDYGVRGQIGLEKTPEDYVAKLVAVFREVRRVLSPGSTLWLVLGDGYARDPDRGVKFKSGRTTYLRNQQAEEGNRGPAIPRGLKEKDLVGMPWRVAFALQQDGWWLRNAIVWAKPNGLPSSVRDRFACKHEYVFLLANAARYRFDLDAVREPFAESTLRRVAQANVLRQRGGAKQTAFWDAVPAGRRQQRSPREIVKSVARSVARAKTAAGDTGAGALHAPGKNPGDVWTIPTAPTRLPHFATFPPALVRRCILAGCPPDGLVLDPFVGVGTTLLVAKELGRHALGIDLNPKYVAIARRRLAPGRLAEGGRRAA